MRTERFQKILDSRKIRIIAIAIICLFFIVILLVSISKPSRSVEAFCNAYGQENMRIEKSAGTTYSVKPFTHSSSNPKDFASAFANLEKVAPNEIEPDVKTLRQIFEKIDKDSSQALSASLSGLGAESTVSGWTDQHCR